jgi:spoIIIJ-associated protein
MTRRITSDGGSLVDALADAVAELADCDRDDVDVEIRAPGFDAGARGSVSLRLELEEAGEPAEERDDEPDDARDDASEESSDDASEDVSDDASEDVSDDASEEPQRGARPSSDGPVFDQGELDEEADAAADFLEGLLDRMQLPGDIKIRLFEDHSEVELVEVGSGALIGRRGQTLEAIQELVRCALQREFQRRTRVKIDVEGYRVRRLEKLLEKAEESIEAVLDSGESERLEPMDVFERKAVHQLVASYGGVSSRSQGREPGRRVIIEPTD